MKKLLNITQFDYRMQIQELILIHKYISRTEMKGVQKIVIEKFCKFYFKNKLTNPSMI
jgi:hypothetical protein